MGRSIDKNIGKNLSSKCSQKFIDHAKQSDTDAIKNASKTDICNHLFNWKQNCLSNCESRKRLAKTNSETNEKEILSENIYHQN